MKSAKEIGLERKEMTTRQMLEVETVLSTSSYKKNFEKLQSYYKPLEGSEKQIAWAEKIRLDISESAAYKATASLIWAYENSEKFDLENSIKRATKDFNEVLNIVASNRASKIIDNR